MTTSERLIAAVHTARPRLQAIPEAVAKTRTAPDKWAPIEVIGHLIDSACNNHARFVQASFRESLIFAGYAQEAWVDSQRYREANWPNTVALWAQYNLHLAHVFTAIPEPTRLRPRTKHDFARMTHGYDHRLPADSLEYMMADYVGHLEHHLRQVLAD